MGKYLLFGYVPVNSVNCPLQTRMPSGVGTGFKYSAPARFSQAGERCDVIDYRD